MLSFNFVHVLTGILVVGTCVSCVSNERITYFQQSTDGTPIEFGELIPYELTDYRLQYNDILDVSVTTMDQLLENGFNLDPNMGSRAGGMMGGMIQGDINYISGYRIDKDGSVDLPILGKIQVGGSTVVEAKKAIEVELKKYVTTEVFVRVRLGGIRFSTLGEFRRSGKFVMMEERLTIFEAIAAAGDLTTIANRDQLVLIRQYPDGSRMHQINLNDRSIIKSPFYFVQPNDLYYAEPMKVREIGAGENASQSLSLLISSVSAFVLILNLIVR